MTFHNPFETNPIPGLQGVAESLDLDSAEVQRLATALYRGALEPLEKDKRKVAALKGALVRPAAQSLRAEDSRTLTGMGQRLRQNAEAQVADTDAEIMLLASRLGARQSAGELPAAPTAEPRPVAGANQGAPCEGAIRPQGWGAKPDWQISQADCPAGWGLVSSEITGLWCCPPGVPLPTDGGTGGGAGTGGGPPPPPPPPPPPAPVYCEPCPVGVPPGGTLASEPDACRKPEGTTPQAVYVVPWLGERVQAASVYSECGEKAVAEAYATLFPAADVTSAIAAHGDNWYGPYIGPTRQMLSDRDPDEEVIGYLYGGR